MYLRSLLHSNAPWVDPRIITKELLLEHEPGRDNLRMAQELRKAWLYSSGGNNTHFMRENPKEFLEMYSALSACHLRHECETYEASPDLQNNLKHTAWHEIYLTGCLRHMAEHRIPLASCNALTALTGTVNKLLADLYGNSQYTKNINGFTEWLKDQENVEDALQSCLQHDLNFLSSAMYSGRTVPRNAKWEHYTKLKLDEYSERALYNTLLLDTLFSKRHFTTNAEQHFPQYTLHFQRWFELMDSLDSNFQESLQTEEWDGDEIFIGLSPHAYDLLESLPRMEGAPFESLLEPEISHIFEKMERA